MKIRVDDPALLPDLVAELLERVDTIVTELDEHLIEVSLLGSRTAEADVAELRERLGAMGRSGVSILEEPGSVARRRRLRFRRLRLQGRPAS